MQLVRNVFLIVGRTRVYLLYVIDIDVIFGGGGVPLVPNPRSGFGTHPLHADNRQCSPVDHTPSGTHRGIQPFHC